MVEELLSYLQRRAGEYLRTVTVYDQEGYEIRYIRDDVDEAATREIVDEAYGGIQSGLQLTSVDDELGKRYATVQVREMAVILHFPREGADGCFVSLDLEAGRQLIQFVTECMDRANDEPTPL
jgi:hypothetical protein